FFVWTPEEVDAAVPEPALAALAKDHFGLTAAGNFEHGKSVLEVVRDAAQLAASSGRLEREIAAELRAALKPMLQTRDERIRPGPHRAPPGDLRRPLAQSRRANRREGHRALLGRRAQRLLLGAQGPERPALPALRAARQRVSLRRLVAHRSAGGARRADRKPP